MIFNPFFKINNIIYYFRAQRRKTDRSAGVATFLLFALIFDNLAFSAYLRGQVCPVVCLCHKTGSRKPERKTRKNERRDEGKMRKRNNLKKGRKKLTRFILVINKFNLKTFKNKNLSPAVYEIMPWSWLFRPAPAPTFLSLRLRLRYQFSSAPALVLVFFDLRPLTFEIRDVVTYHLLISSLFKPLIKLLGDSRKQMTSILSLPGPSGLINHCSLSHPYSPQAKNVKIPQDKKLMDWMILVWKWMVIIEMYYTKVLVLLCDYVRSLSHVTAAVLQ